MGRINLGDRVRSKVDGFEGVVQSVCDHLYGIRRMGVTAPAKDGKAGETAWYDEGALELVHPATAS